LIFKIGKYGEESDAYKTLGHSIIDWLNIVIIQHCL